MRRLATGAGGLTVVWTTAAATWLVAVELDERDELDELDEPPQPVAASATKSPPNAEARGLCRQS
jgi:hypothetical protein